MFIVKLKFSDNKSLAKDYMEGHKAWLQTWFEKGVFILSGSIKPSGGGAIIAIGVGQMELESIIAEDPFVIEGVVKPEITELAVSKSDERLSFLLE
ncbi:hypothetical protein A7985_07780 [Pseudoalteromonas luteoviolacea]|uniref:YCII-related domain-containing protein n=1 Tax=Pseudoalteromonas luteoviolacea TaxID=43657 RepID=A0A1C0TWY3_9GAMM|nr:hypothetical protein [Pseudoalteromonas luteoviolacea]OCQ23828.1 hypothetical protein A7985_07780 [Pseudoalteromonas luteoviolacea]